MSKPILPFPLRFTIKGARWRVKFEKDLNDEGKPCQGLTDTDSRTITIDSSVSDAHLVWVFWHEYAHALLHEACVTGNTGGLSDILEEIICDNFAEAMTRDKVVTWKRRKKQT